MRLTAHGSRLMDKNEKGRLNVAGVPIPILAGGLGESVSGREAKVDSNTHTKAYTW